MIIILFSKPEFEYDVHSLVKAFYPREEISMYYTCPPGEVEEQNLACTHHEAGEELDALLAASSHVFRVNYEEERILLTWTVQADGQARTSYESSFAVEWQNRQAVKNTLKRSLYDLLEKGSGQTLPWGTLTGIRPTKDRKSVV